MYIYISEIYVIYADKISLSPLNPRKIRVNAVWTKEKLPPLGRSGSPTPFQRNINYEGRDSISRVAIHYARWHPKNSPRFTRRSVKRHGVCTRADLSSNRVFLLLFFLFLSFFLSFSLFLSLRATIYNVANPWNPFHARPANISGRLLPISVGLVHDSPIFQLRNPRQ